MRFNKNLILPYNKRLLIEKKRSSKKQTFNSLIKLSSKVQGPLFDELKIYMVLIIKWHFDFLSKTRRNPKFLEKSINYFYDIFTIFYFFSKIEWTKILVKKYKKDVWSNTKKAFNFMWPRNTKNQMFLASSILANLRIKNIIANLKNKNIFKNKIILDSGCGPGRYIAQLLKYNPKKIIGIDSGKDIIKNNKIRFKKYKKIKFIHSTIDNLPLPKESVDFVISAGVLHHTKTSINRLIKDHARVIKPKGYFFVFIVSDKGQELELWNFCRKVMKNIDIKFAFNFLRNKIHPLRLQGFLDHSYGEYKLTSKKYLLKILKRYFSSVQELQGVKGADVTKINFSNDKYFKKRFGSGNLRFLCVK